MKRKLSHFIKSLWHHKIYRSLFIFGITLLIALPPSLLAAKYVKNRLTSHPVYNVSSTTPHTPTPVIPENTSEILEPGPRVLLPGAKWIAQTFNNCGPATTSMALQYFGFNVDQNTTKSALRTNPDDKNVFTYEMQAYLRDTYGIHSKILFNGTRQTMKKLLTNGFYIIAEDWLHPDEDIGHVTIIRGYDDEQGVFIADDSYLGKNIIYKYDEFEEKQWKAFNREYMPLYRPEHEEKVKAIIGEDWDERVMYEKAIAKAQEEIGRNDRDMYAYFNMGTSYYGLGEYEKAGEAFTKAKQIGWPRRMLWYQIQPVQTLNELGRYEDALRLADEGLWANDSFAELHVEKARSYKGLGNTQKAREEIEKALHYAPKLQSALNFDTALVEGSATYAGEVLGVSYFGSTAGSPLVPPEIVTYYFLGFFSLLVILYVFLHHLKQPVLLWHKFKLLVIVAVLLKIVLICGGSILAAYWLLPKPHILQTSPINDTINIGTKKTIEIIFDKPISRNTLEKSVTPEVPGVWVFEDAIYSTHFYRKVTFVPTQTFSPDTIYTVSLTNIQNSLKVSKPYSYTFSFKTQPSPKIASVFPVDKTQDVRIDTPLTIMLTDPNDKISEFEFSVEPYHPITSKLDSENKKYTLSPTIPWKQGTTYTITAKKTDIVLNIPTNTIVERKNTTQEYQGTFTTKEPPGITNFLPESENASPSSRIVFSFNEAMNKESVQKNLSVTPQVVGSVSWPDDKTLIFTPQQRLPYETEYKVTVAKGTTSSSAGFLEEDIVKTFKTIGYVKVKNFSPNDGWKAVGIHNTIQITFDQEVDKASAESKFSITPSIDGTFSWNGTTMIFSPSAAYGYSTKYTATVASGVKTIRGLDSNKSFATSFTTQEQVVKLSVPVYLQKYSLSCEIASLRMALAHKGVQLSEDTIYSQVGQDPTPHNGNTWGNPNQAFVGNINGRQMADGYGVHWGPIARAARMHRNAEEFQNGDITKITQALSQNHAVVIWVYSGGGYPTSWNTPDGQSIFAYRDEHAVTAVGYVGPANNPSQIIINDPLIGQVYWPRSLFDRKWKSFSNAGVIVY